ncbi:hypothetical protein EYB25_009314 [Talaromyces marneffei]|nr:hypothetical protein EYB25_009314 [Talaromyces marneffei]
MYRDLQKRAGVLAILASGVFAATSTGPCAQIAKSYASNQDPNVSADLALGCLMSMPFDSKAAVTWIDEYTKYLQFQSDLEILENSPATYPSTNVDLLGGFQSIRTKAISGTYKSQYQFDESIQDLITSANDGHLWVDTCSTSAFVFYTDVGGIASISADGSSPPSLYVGVDAVRLAKGLTAPMSPLAYINNIGAAHALESLSVYQNLQDPDARYNAMVNNLVIDGQGNSLGGLFAQDTVWRGAEFYNFTFANGTSQQYTVQAQIRSPAQPFNFTDGNELYTFICTSTQSSTTTSKRSTVVARVDTSSSTPSAPALYPVPVMKEAYNTIVGYYPDDAGLEDVAVLGVPTFETSGSNLPDDVLYNFAITAEWFVQNATQKDGKKKIIIDMQNNGGGVVVSGYALLSVFFPNETIYSGTRFRAHEAMDFIGTIFNYGNNSDNSTVSRYGLAVNALVQPDQTSTFQNWDEVYGPYTEAGIPVSALMAEFNFADEANPVSNPINIDGEGGELNARTPPFAPENIIILTDGRCSSTCTVFVDHMVSKGVKTVAVGGRPRAGVMQAIGGVKGSEVLGLTDVESMATTAASLLADSISSGSPILGDKNQARFSEVNPIPLTKFPMPISGSINYLNTYTAYDDTTPTQFTYEAANCHIFYTAETLYKPSTTWALAANSTWGSAQCVGGIQANTDLGEYDENNETTTSTSSGLSTALGLLLALGSGLS